MQPVGNTVDAKTATYKNSIGDTQLTAVWTDPDFDPTLHAVYYVRVLEIPTPRWSTYDAVSLGRPIPEGLPASIQERAWSSPIWYVPTFKERFASPKWHYPGIKIDPKLLKKAGGHYPGLQQIVP